jgi:sodium-dependent dicarboxylate transporter 2/3/5
VDDGAMTPHARPADLALLVRRIGFCAGPALALVLYVVLPAGETVAEGTLSPAGLSTLAVMGWMATWWMTEAVPIEATSLLPIVVFPLLGVTSLAATTAAYGSDVVFLFMGGFVLAAAIQKHGLDRRIAFATLRVVGARPGAIVGGIMAATAFLSMWVSNTATAAMMVPIALSVIDVSLQRSTGRTLAEHGGIPVGDIDNRNLALATLLGVAYAASIGGLGTIVGSPPNGILVRYLETRGVSVGFLEWMAIGVPAMLLFLPLAWLINVKLLFPTRIREIEGGREYLAGEWAKLGSPGRGERVTLAVFACTVALWIFRPLLIDVAVGGVRPFANLSDAGIAMAAALALFMIPVDRERRAMAMDWETAVKLPWGVLILFGGGLALAGAAEANGVAVYIGTLAEGLSAWPAWAALLAMIAIMVFMSEVTSNTAQVATMVPLLAAIAPVLGLPAAMLLIPATLGASCAFMMPVGTPPNAIVFGTGLVRIPQMMRAGLWLNLTGILLIFALSWWGLPPLLAALRFA